MNLGLFFAIGESFKEFKKYGQDQLIIRQNLKSYSRSFNKVYVFTYKNENYHLFENNVLVANKSRLHRYIYSILLPIYHVHEIKNCDVLRGYQITGGLPCLIAKLFFNKPFVVNYGYDYEKFAEIEGKKLQSILYKVVSPIILKLADAIIVTTPKLALKIKSICPNKTYVIPNSVDIKMFSPSQKKKNNHHKLKIIFIGRLESQKNLINLLEAITMIKTDLSILFIGRGSQKEILKKIAKEKNITLSIIDSIPHNRIPSYLRSADVFILPSLKEGHPKVLLEAMAVGLPCIASNVEGNKEIIIDGKNGILSGTEAGELKKSIEKLIINTNLRTRLSKSARAYIIENYNSSVWLQKENNLLKELVSKK